MTDGNWTDHFLDMLRRRRDRLVASPAFQRFAAGNPLTRPFARRRGRALLDVMAGFVYSQTLAACVQLKLFDMLKEGPLSAETIAERAQLPAEGARRLLDAAVSLDLLDERSGGRYGLGQLGAGLLGNDAAMALVVHQPALYADLADPVALLRGEKTASLAGYWPYSAAQDPASLAADQVGPYSALMAASQPMVAQEALAAFSFEGKRRLLDVGGGEGVFLSAIGARYPHLRLALFDLPAVVERARARLAAAGLTERTSLHGGSFLTDPLPVGADVISLVRIVHDHDDDSALALLRNIRRALAADGVLLIVEAMSGVRGVEPLDAYYGFYTLAMGRGEPRTVAEIGALLRQAGFSRHRLLANPLPIVTSVLAAYPE